MAFANISDILATTIESRSKAIQDNVTKNNALLARLNQGKRIKTFSGGHKILEPISFAENGNAGWYSGYDTLPVAAQDVISAAEYTIKQAAVPVIISGLEKLQNAGKEALIDLMEERLAVAEASLANLIAAGIYSDGTGSSGKQLTGLNAAVAASPTTGTYGGIDRAVWTFWRNQTQASGGLTGSNILAQMNTLYAKLVRGVDRPDLIPMDSTVWGLFVGALQPLQRFATADTASVGFPTLKFMDADVVLDGGIGGFCPASTYFMLNTKYLKFRPHADRNMVPLAPSTRTSINQDAEVQILAFAGNLTCSGAQFQGRGT